MSVMLLRTASHRGSVIVRGFHPAEDLSLPEGCPFQNTNGFQYADAGLFLSIFLGVQSTFRLKGGRQHGVSRLLALQTAEACSTFTSTAKSLAGRDEIIIIYPRNAANCCPVMNEYSLHIF